MSLTTKATALTKLLGRKCLVKLQSGYTFTDKLIAIETGKEGAFLIFEKTPIRYNFKEISSIEEYIEKFLLIFIRLYTISKEEYIEG